MKTQPTKRIRTKRVNHGFIPDQITPDQYVLGQALLPQVELQPDGQWDAFLPSDEIQLRNDLETCNCTGFGTHNCIETLFRRLFNEDRNFSDRYTGTLAGTRPPGNSPHVVAETIRTTSGLIDEALLPFGPDINTIEEYYSLLPLGSKATKLGAEWLKQHDFKHEWVFSDPGTALSVKRDRLKQALRYSPLGVSVYAWSKKGPYYVKPKGAEDTHWCMLYGFEEGKFWKVFDSYDSTHKKLAWDFDFGYAKRYYVAKKNAGEQLSPGVLAFFIEQFRAINEALKRFIKPTPAPAPTPAPQPAPAPSPEPPKATVADILYSTAKACLERDIAATQDELGCAEAVSYVLKQAKTPGLPAGGFLSTASLYKWLLKSSAFRKVAEPQPGDIIISPTGYGNGKLSHGHVGIVGKKCIMSNDSRTGLFDCTYTLASWKAYYQGKGGFPVDYFRRF